MPQVGFEPTIPVFARVKTVHASDREPTVIGNLARASQITFHFTSLNIRHIINKAFKNISVEFY
jgi:hypothetical protein